MKQITKIIYTAGVVLDVEDMAAAMYSVKKCFKNIYAHHMTIQFGGLAVLPDYIGKEITFVSTRWFEDDKASTLAGYVVKCDDSLDVIKTLSMLRQNPHITLATASDIKPVYSNELLKSNDYVHIYPISVRLKVGAFCEFADGTTGWVYEK